MLTDFLLTIEDRFPEEADAIRKLIQFKEEFGVNLEMKYKEISSTHDGVARSIKLIDEGGSYTLEFLTIAKEYTVTRVPLSDIALIMLKVLLEMDAQCTSGSKSDT